MPKKKNNTIQTAALPLVVIDLSSSGVRALAAKRMDKDLLQILAAEHSCKYPQYMERGVVTQSSNASYMINEVLTMLANRLDGISELPAVFTLMGGRSMQIAPVSAKRDQIRPRTVKLELLEEMQRECKQKIEDHNKDVGVLGIVPNFFVLDGNEQDHEPTPEQYVTRIEGHYTAFVGTREMTQQVQKSFSQSGKTIESSFVRPEAVLSAIAAQEGLDLLDRGCAVLDMGAQTTTLTLYKEGTYIFNKVIPQGSGHITRTIAQQGVTLALAERLKCEYGYASPEQVERNLRLRVPASPDNKELGSELVVTTKDLATLISEKLEEILTPLLRVLNDNADRIPTIFLTGGGAMLQGFDEYLSQRVPQHVQFATHGGLITSTDTPDELYEPRYTALIGALLLAADYRDAHKTNVVQTTKGTIVNTLLDLFSDQTYQQ